MADSAWMLRMFLCESQGFFAKGEGGRLDQ